MTTTFRRLAVTVCAWLVPMALPAQQPLLATLESARSSVRPAGSLSLESSVPIYQVTHEIVVRQLGHQGRTRRAR